MTKMITLLPFLLLMTGGANAAGDALYEARDLFLAGANPFGKVSVKQLYEYLSPLVSDEARRQNPSQSPQLAGQNSNWSLF